jgi:hypothetical protein
LSITKKSLESLRENRCNEKNWQQLEKYLYFKEEKGKSRRNHSNKEKIKNIGRIIKKGE